MKLLILLSLLLGMLSLPVKAVGPQPRQISVYRAGTAVWFFASRRTKAPSDDQQRAVKALRDALDQVRTKAPKFDANGNLFFEQVDKTQILVIIAMKDVYSAFGIEVGKVAGQSILDRCRFCAEATVNTGLNELYYERENVEDEFFEPLLKLMRGSTSKSSDGTVRWWT